MAKTSRTLLVDGYQPKATDNLKKLRRNPATGQFLSTSPKSLPKATSVIQKPGTAKPKGS